MGNVFEENATQQREPWHDPKCARPYRFKVAENGTKYCPCCLARHPDTPVTELEKAELAKLMSELESRRPKV
jgi:hypothetical protein